MYPAMIDARNPKNTGRKFASIADPMSFICRMNAPNIAGIDSMKLNFAANSLSKPMVSPAAIVVPDLESPGSIAHACPSPMNSASFFVMLLYVMCPLFILCDRYRIVPVTNRKNAGTYTAPANSASIESSKNIPASPTGIVAMITYHASLLYGSS